jgi:serine/threonine-protein kinase
MPFTNTSLEPENEFLSVGIAEDLITALSRVPGLHVPGRSSCFAFKGKSLGLRAIGQVLNVETVLEGSVRKCGNHLRITVELINVADGFRLWSERYDREMRDVFAIQDDIAQTVLEALKLKLGGRPLGLALKRYTENTQAYQLYLRGKFCVGKWTAEGIATGMSFLEQAIQIEPQYLLPRVVLGHAYLLLSYWGYLPPKEGFPKSKAMIAQALALDDALGPAHAILGADHFFYDWDWPGAEREFKRAVELDPNHSDTRSLYSFFLFGMVRREEALAEIRKALDLDPLSLFANMMHCFALLALERYEESEEQARRLLALEPGYWGGYWARSAVSWLIGRKVDAMADLEKAFAVGGGPLMLGYLGRFAALLGDTAKAMRALDELKAMAQQRYVPAICMVHVYLGLGQREAVFAWWDRAVEERSSELAFWKMISVMWFPNDPDLPRLLKKCGL